MACSVIMISACLAGMRTSGVRAGGGVVQLEPHATRYPLTGDCAVPDSNEAKFQDQKSKIGELPTHETSLVAKGLGWHSRAWGREVAIRN